MCKGFGLGLIKNKILKIFNFEKSAIYHHNGPSNKERFSITLSDSLRRVSKLILQSRVVIGLRSISRTSLVESQPTRINFKTRLSDWALFSAFEVNRLN